MLINIIKIVVAFILSFIFSTLFIRKGIPKLRSETGKAIKIPGSNRKNPLFDIRSIGFWIGFFETLLIFIFVYKNEYGAMAIIFAAKEFVRKDDIKKNPSYFYPEHL